MTTPNPPEIMSLGRVVGVYGIQGWVKVFSNCDPHENILNYPRWTLTQRGQVLPYSFHQGKSQGKNIIVQLRHTVTGAPLTDRNAAQLLMGAEITAPLSDRPKLPKGEYYWDDIIGLAVYNDTGADAHCFGTVTQLLETGASDILVVVAVDSDGKKQQTLIPFVRPEIVKKIELAKGRMTVAWEPDSA